MLIICEGLMDSQRSPTNSQSLQNYISSKNSSTTSVVANTQPSNTSSNTTSITSSDTTSITSSNTTSNSDSIKVTGKKSWKKNVDFISSTDSDWFGPEDKKSPPQTTSLTPSAQTPAAMSNISATSSTTLHHQQPHVNTSYPSSSHDISPGKIEGRVLPSPPKESPTKVVPSKPIINQQKELQITASSPKKDDEWVVVHKHDAIVADTTAAEILEINTKIARIEKLQAIVFQEDVDMEILRKFCWNGIPDELRPITWKLLLVYC